MSDSFNPSNSIWPNGMKVDEEGYAVFYPLGTNKTNISTITWPEGNKLVSPFVYDKNDKLVGLADTKALEIDNNDTTININYTHFDADLDSIMENTLTINAPENATVNVKYGAVDKVLTEKIEKVLGKGNCKVKFDKDTNKAIVAVALDTTESQLADVQTLLDRVLPRNLVTEMEWANGLPVMDGYMPLEYLESRGTQFIDCAYLFTQQTGLFAKTYAIYGNRQAMGNRYVSVPCPRFSNYTPQEISVEWNAQRLVLLIPLPRSVIVEGWINWKNSKNARAVSELGEQIVGLEGIPKSDKIKLFQGGAYWYGKIFNAAISEAGSIVRQYIPALDPTGAPCMFDTVTRTPFYNSGTGDFTYPGAEQAVQTTDLDAKSYAKLTEHGVRRLYKVPKGYVGSMDEYAAANGFKELVEPPMPLEGYWMPEWRETETQLICDWIKTEPPVEEEIINNEN